MDKYSKLSINYDANSTKKRNLNILIIDDDTTVAECLGEYLEQRGHIVNIVDEGTRGLCQFKNKNFDIVFLDYHLDNDGCINNNSENIKLSKIDGAIISECLKDDSNNSNLIFAYTGDNSQNAINRCKNAGMDGIVFKPVNEKILNKLMISLETKNIVSKNDLLKTAKYSRDSIIMFD